MSNLRKIAPYGRTYNKLKRELQDSYCWIRACQKCGHPTRDGYCCTFCGDDDPTRPPETRRPNEQY